MMPPQVVHNLNQKASSPILRLNILLKYRRLTEGPVTSCGGLLAVQCPLGSSSLDITPFAPNSTQMKKKILIVEDNTDLIYFLQKLVQLLGYDTIGAINSKQAVDTAATHCHRSGSANKFLNFPLELLNGKRLNNEIITPGFNAAPEIQFAEENRSC